MKAYRKSVKCKIVILICVAVLGMLATGIGFGDFAVRRLLLRLVEKDHTTIAQLLARSISGMLDEEVEHLQTLLSCTCYREAIEESNAHYRDMDSESIRQYMAKKDSEWRDARDDSALIRGYLEKEAGRELRNADKNSSDIAEIFITDKWGGLVASSGKTSDFYQADEAWWQEAFDHGRGKVFIGDAAFDESAQSWSIPFSLPVRNSEGEVIGIGKVIVDIESFWEPLGHFRIGTTGHAVLVDENGYLLYHKGIAETFGKEFITGKQFEALVKDGQELYILDAPHCHENSIVTVFSEVPHPLLLGRGVVWRVFVDQAADEVFAPFVALRFQTGAIVLLTLVIIITVGFVFGHMLVRPIAKLREATNHIAEGDLDYRVHITTGDEIEGLAASFNAMTEQLQTTAPVTKAYVDSIIASMVDSLIVISSDGTITTVNQAAIDVSGYTKEELIGKHFSVLFPKEDMITRLIDKGEIRGYEINFMAKDGREIPVMVSGAVLKNVDCPYQQSTEECTASEKKDARDVKMKAAVLVVRDITERTKVEKEIIRARERLYFLVKHTPAVIYGCEPQGDYEPTFISDNIEVLLGYTAQEFLTGPKLRVNNIHPDDKERVFTGLSDMTHRNRGRHEYRFMHKNGTYRWMLDELSVIRDDNGQLLEIIGCWIDITERKRTEQILHDTCERLKDTQEQLTQSGKMAAIGQLAAGISHELNQPLTGIKGFAQAVLMDLEKKSPFRSDLEVIVEQADRISSIIKNVRFFARKSECGTEEMNINKPIEDALSLLNGQLRVHNIRIKKSLARDLPMIHGDENQLQQAFFNLIANAQDAIDSLEGAEGGELTIETSLGKDKKNVEIIIRDTGCGIPRRYRFHIFDPFFTTKSPQEGIGLGLSIVYRIIENHNGEIKLESEEGKGTMFRIALPVCSADTDRARDKKKILLVDDDPHIVALLVSRLKAHEYDAVVACNAMEGVRMAHLEQPDLIILDIRMPAGGGFALFKNLRLSSRTIGIPVIFITAYPDDEIRKSVFEMGASDFLAKPFHSDELLRKVHHVLREDRPQSTVYEQLSMRQE